MSWILCINNTGYEASLEPKKLYEQIEDTKAQSLGMVRIIDESGEDYLYSQKLFIAIPEVFESKVNEALMI